MIGNNNNDGSVCAPDREPRSGRALPGSFLIPDGFRVQKLIESHIVTTCSIFCDVVLSTRTVSCDDREQARAPYISLYYISKNSPNNIIIMGKFFLL